MGKANPALSPHPVKQEKKGEGLPFPSYSSYLGFLSCNERNAFLTGRAKKRREMNREEGETKQGAKKMALFFIYS